MDKLLAIISVIQRISSKNLLVQLISNIVMIMGLVMTTAIIISATVIGGLINAHMALLNNDTSPLLALVYVGGGALFIIFGLFAMIAWRLRCLRKIPHSIFGQSTFTSHITDALDAFTDGLMAK